MNILKLILIFLIIKHYYKSQIYNKKYLNQENKINNLKLIESLNRMQEDDIQIYIYAEKKNFKFFEDYINSINKILKAKIIDKIDNNLDIMDKNNIIIFMQKLPFLNFKINNYNKNLFILNTEQLTQKPWLNYFIEKSKDFMIIDYSRENISIMNDNNINNVIYFPYIYNEDEIYNLKKTNNVCGIAFNVFERRRKFYNNLLKKKIKVDNITGWKDQRDNLLFRYKIILNISGIENRTIFETLRCNRCLFNKMIIISEHKYKKELIDYADHILFAKIEDIPDLVNDVLSNYEYYYKKLDLDNINYTLNNHFINRKFLIDSNKYTY